MTRTFLIGLVAVAACGGRSGEPPGPGSGSARPQIPPLAHDAAVITRDAAAPDAAAPGRLAPGATYTLAMVRDGQLTLVRLDAAGVHAQPIVAIRSDERFGWLDPRTLVLFTPPGVSDKPMISKIVDGAVAESSELDPAWGGATLQITRGGEAWLSRCVEETPGRACAHEAFLRVVPGHGTRTAKGPRDRDADRSDAIYGELPTVPPSPGPAGYALTRAQASARCAAPARPPVTYPADVPAHEKDTDVRITDVHWVLADPPIFEVAGDKDDGNDGRIPVREFFRACATTELDGFRSLGGAVWAARDDAAWVISAGSTEVARITGDDLRPAPAAK